MIVFTKQTEELWRQNNTGNFSLWFNKYVPVDELNMKVCDNEGTPDEASSFYVKQYLQRTKSVTKLLEAKHKHQKEFVESIRDLYVIQDYQIELQTPLVLGMGESHPSENGLTLDHNMGIPYIPASSIKGALRHAYTVNLIRELEQSGRLQDYIIKCKEKNNYKEYECLDEIKTEIPEIFGGELLNKKNKKEEVSGNIVVLDAYPTEIPSLQEDIMNNHYSKYYEPDNDKKYPSDTEEPKPVKFISITPKIKYHFYILVKKDVQQHLSKIEKAVEQMFRNGLGAKTATGYGRFNWDKYEIERLDREEKEKEKQRLAEEEVMRIAEQKKAEEDERGRLEDEKRKKEEEKTQAEENRKKKAELEAKKSQEARTKALGSGIQGLMGAKYFKALEGIKYICIDHSLSDDEIAGFKEILIRIYNKDKKSKKWKKSNDGNWREIGSWIGGSLKNKLFKEITGNK